MKQFNLLLLFYFCDGYVSKEQLELWSAFLALFINWNKLTYLHEEVLWSPKIIGNVTLGKLCMQAHINWNVACKPTPSTRHVLTVEEVFSSAQGLSPSQTPSHVKQRQGWKIERSALNFIFPCVRLLDQRTEFRNC